MLWNLKHETELKNIKFLSPMLKPSHLDYIYNFQSCSPLQNYSQVGEKLRTDTFGRNNAHPVSREREGALCSVTHAPERRRIEDHWPGKFPQNNALFYCNLNSKQEVRFHHDIKFLLLLGNFSIAQAFFAF